MDIVQRAVEFAQRRLFDIVDRTQVHHASAERREHCVQWKPTLKLRKADIQIISGVRILLHVDYLDTTDPLRMAVPAGSGVIEVLYTIPAARRWGIDSTSKFSTEITDEKREEEHVIFQKPTRCPQIGLSQYPGRTDALQSLSEDSEKCFVSSSKVVHNICLTVKRAFECQLSVRFLIQHS